MTDQNIATPPTTSNQTIRKRITVAGLSTTVRLEPVFWTALKHIAKARGIPMNRLVSIWNYTRDPACSLVREIRCNCVEWLLRELEGDRSPSIMRAPWRPR